MGYNRQMDIDEIRSRFTPAIKEITEQCLVTDDFVDKDMFQVYITTVWGNAVLEPERSGIEESDLPVLHDYLSEELARMVGQGQDLTRCFEYLMSKDGEDCLARLQVTARHREFINYFGRLMLAAGG